MIRNYILTTWRNFRSNQGYTIITLLGLSIAFVVVFMTTAYIRYETSFDKNYKNAEQIYRLIEKDILKSTSSGWVRAGLAYHIEDTFAEVEAVTNFYPSYNNKGSKIMSDYGSSIVSTANIDTSFFDVFDLSFIEGSTLDAKELKSAVLTRTIAKALFPNQDPIGKSVIRKTHGVQEHNHIVKAVIEDMPANNHFCTDVLFVTSNAQKQALSFTDAYSTDPQYIRLKNNTNTVAFEQKMNAFFLEKGMDSNRRIELLPVQDIHLNASHIEQLEGNIQNNTFVYMFGLSGILILLIGYINYINIYLAKLIGRQKEVGIRKIIGAKQHHLIFQTLIESFVFFVLAVGISILIAYICWPAFSQLLEITSDIKYLFNFFNVSIVVVLALVCSIVVSIYPMIHLRENNAIKLLQQKIGKKDANLNPQKVLIVFQFSIAIVLIIGTLVIHSQVHFFTNRSMGFDKDNLLVIPNVHNKTNVLKEELKQIPSISEVSFANNAQIGTGYGAASSMTNPKDTTKNLSFGFLNTDLDFIRAMKVRLVAGRNFTLSDAALVEEIYNKTSDSRNWQTDYARVPIIITEATAKELDITTVDTTLRLGALQGTVIGIIEDFQMTSFKEEGQFVIFRSRTEASGNAYIRLASENIPATLDHIKKVWKNVFPDEEFNYQFVDEQIENMYKKENQLASLFTIFSVISIGISVLGLFSLIAITVKKRTKEIGIRKVLGASVSSITTMLSKDFIKLVLFAMIIASPIAWWTMNTWLEDFAYRIDIQWWMFIIAGCLAVLITLLTIGVQSIKAALTNPVDSLRDE